MGIGFGLSTQEADQLYALAEVANTRGKASTSDMLYAMHQEDAQTGKPLPYMTYNKDQLVSAFKSIMGTVKGVVFYGSAPAATTSTDLGDSVLVASFTSGNWAGELQAIDQGYKRPVDLQHLEGDRADAVHPQRVDRGRQQEHDGLQRQHPERRQLAVQAARRHHPLHSGGGGQIRRTFTPSTNTTVSSATRQ